MNDTIQEREVYERYRDFVHYLVNNVSPFVRLNYDIRVVDIKDAKAVILESKRILEVIQKEIDSIRKDKLTNKNKKDGQT